MLLGILPYHSVRRFTEHPKCEDVPRFRENVREHRDELGGEIDVEKELHFATLGPSSCAAYSSAAPMSSGLS